VLHPTPPPRKTRSQGKKQSKKQKQEEVRLEQSPPRSEKASDKGAPAAAPAGLAASAPRKVRYEDFTLGDLTAIRNLLRGGSVIDWHRLYFTDRDEVDRFLRVNDLDPRDEDDMRRMAELRELAV